MPRKGCGAGAGTALTDTTTMPSHKSHTSTEAERSQTARPTGPHPQSNGWVGNGYEVIGIDSEGCSHCYSDRANCVFVISDGHRTRRQPLGDRHLDEWLAFVAEKRGWVLTRPKDEPSLIDGTPAGRVPRPTNRDRYIKIGTDTAGRTHLYRTVDESLHVITEDGTRVLTALFAQNGASIWADSREWSDQFLHNGDMFEQQVERLAESIRKNP
jgi:hypothetical protein